MVNGFKPATLDEALSLLRDTRAVPYAGGTDLMVENRPGISYLFIGHLPELRQIRADDTLLRIGAAVTFTRPWNPTGACPYEGGPLPHRRPGHPQCRNLRGKYWKRLRQGGHRAH